MAYVVSRKDGRFEIRESVATPRGPRGRTLATFRLLSDEVLDHAESRALTPFDRATIRERAEARGVPFQATDTARVARLLLEELVGDRPVPVTLLEAIRGEISRLTPTVLPDALTSAGEWLGVTPADRGNALRDLLRMTDRIPQRTRPDHTDFPRIRSALT